MPYACVTEHGLKNPFNLLRKCAPLHPRAFLTLPISQGHLRRFAHSPPDGAPYKRLYLSLPRRMRRHARGHLSQSRSGIAASLSHAPAARRPPLTRSLSGRLSALSLSRPAQNRTECVYVSRLSSAGRKRNLAERARETTSAQRRTPFRIFPNPARHSRSVVLLVTTTKRSAASRAKLFPCWFPTHHIHPTTTSHVHPVWCFVQFSFSIRRRERPPALVHLLPFACECAPREPPHARAKVSDSSVCLCVPRAAVLEFS